MAAVEVGNYSAFAKEKIRIEATKIEVVVIIVDKDQDSIHQTITIIITVASFIASSSYLGHKNSIKEIHPSAAHKVIADTQVVIIKTA